MSKRILMLPGAMGMSHLQRLLIFSYALKQGNRVGLVGKRTEAHRGIELFPLSDVDTVDFEGNVFSLYQPSSVGPLVKGELRVIETFQPDVIVGDFRPTAAISSRIAGVPYVSVVNGYATDFFDPVDVLLPEGAGALKRAFTSRIARGIQAIQKRALVTSFRVVARRHGIRDLVSLYDFLEGDLTLIADLPQFCPLSNLPPSFRYIGPLIWEGPGAPPVPAYLEHRDPQKPLIYVTTGNTGSAELLRLAEEAFQDDDSCDVVMTTGAFIEPRRASRRPHFHVERFIPGSEVMRRCVAAIHCGGSGTTYQALKHGVPSVVVPFNSDQRINAWLIKRRRVGIPLASSGLTGARLKAALRAVLHDEIMRRSLDEFKELLAGADGPGIAAREIIGLLGAERGDDINREIELEQEPS